MNKYIIIFILLMISHLSTASAETNETELYLKITSYARSGDRDKTVALSNIFLRKYPASRRAPAIRLIQAENEKNPERAIKNYFSIYKLPKFKRRDYALYMACKISYLISDWEKLYDLSLKGIKKIKEETYKNNFRLYFVLANIYHGDYDTAGDECLNLIDHDRNYQRLASTLIILSYINKKKSGYSREYIANLRDIIAGYKKSDVCQTVIYLLGDFYDKKGQYDRAYSAYLDLIKHYPDSPESEFASVRIAELKKLNPKKTDYFPDEKTIRKFDNIEISPDNEIGKESKSNFYYSISVGPFKTLDEAKKIQTLVKGFRHTKTVKYNSSYNLFLEKTYTIEDALKLKIRLAEEYGINGKIIRISNESKKKYIYRE